MNILSLYLGYITDLIVGDPYSFPHPVKYIGKLIKVVENFIRKVAKSDKGLKIGGFFLWFITVGITFLITYIIIKLVSFNMVIYVIINSVVIYTTLATKCLKDEAKKIYEVLKTGNIEKSRIQLSYIVGRDTENLSEKEIIRATVETVAENTVDGLISPLFYAFIGAGLTVGGISLAAPLAMTYKAINTLDSTVGYKNEKYIEFGYFPAKLDHVFDYIPARLSGYLITIASFILGLDYKNSLKIYKRDKNNHSSPNSAHPEAAVAGALNIQLGGANYYFGKLVEKPTIGDCKEKVSIDKVNDVNNILYCSAILGCIMSLIIKFIVS